MVMHRLCELNATRNRCPMTYQYQEFFHCTDLGSQLKPIIDRYHATAARREWWWDKPLLAPEWEGSHPPVTADNQADRPVDLRCVCGLYNNKLL